MRIRVALALTSVLVLGWIGVLTRDLYVVHSVGALPDPRHTSDGEFNVMIDRFRSADLLNPDTRWQINRAKFYLVRGLREKSRGEARDVVRREPENIEAWTVLYNVSQGRDPAGARRAGTEITRLDPLSVAR